jgi:hypothetical protein
VQGVGGVVQGEFQFGQTEHGVRGINRPITNRRARGRWPSSWAGVSPCVSG